MASVQITIVDSPDRPGKIDIQTKWRPGLDEKHPENWTPAERTAHAVFEQLTRREA